MSLTIGNTPFGDRPGVFNSTREGPAHVLYLEDLNRGLLERPRTKWS